MEVIGSQARPRQPGAECTFAVAEDADRGTEVQSIGLCREDFGNPVRSRFQAREYQVPADAECRGTPDSGCSVSRACGPWWPWLTRACTWGSG